MVILIMVESNQRRNKMENDNNWFVYMDVVMINFYVEMGFDFTISDLGGIA